MIRIDTYGYIRYFNKDGKRHRVNDLPAGIFASGLTFCWKNGKRYFLEKTKVLDQTFYK